jgi:hypothetical protein
MKYYNIDKVYWNYNIILSYRYLLKILKQINICKWLNLEETR